MRLNHTPQIDTCIHVLIFEIFLRINTAKSHKFSTRQLLIYSYNKWSPNAILTIWTKIGCFTPDLKKKEKKRKKDLKYPLTCLYPTLYKKRAIIFFILVKIAQLRPVGGWLNNPSNWFQSHAIHGLVKHDIWPLLYIFFSGAMNRFMMWTWLYRRYTYFVILVIVPTTTFYIGTNVVSACARSIYVSFNLICDVSFVHYKRSQLQYHIK